MTLRTLFPGPTREEREYLEGLAGEPFDPAKPCSYCGAPMGEHVIGGPGQYHPRPFKRVSYDIASFLLAEQFLSDEPPYLKALTHQLATEIQRTIEDFIEYERRVEDGGLVEAPSKPVFYGAQCPSYPNCTGGCGLGCTHEIEAKRRDQRS